MTAFNTEFDISPSHTEPTEQSAIADELRRIGDELHAWIERQRELQDRLFGLEELATQSAGGPIEQIAEGGYMPVLPRTGDIIMTHQGDFIPPGWLLCSGLEVSKSDYIELYKVIGDVYGLPSQTGVFKLPGIPDLVPTTTSIPELAAWLGRGLRYIIRI